MYRSTTYTGPKQQTANIIVMRSAGTITHKQHSEFA